MLLSRFLLCTSLLNIILPPSAYSTLAVDESPLSILHQLVKDTDKKNEKVTYKLFQDIFNRLKPGRPIALNRLDDRQCTVLDYAESKQWYSMVQLLESHGAQRGRELLRATAPRSCFGEFIQLILEERKEVKLYMLFIFAAFCFVHCFTSQIEQCDCAPSIVNSATYVKEDLDRWKSVDSSGEIALSIGFVGKQQKGETQSQFSGKKEGDKYRTLALVYQKNQQYRLAINAYVQAIRQRKNAQSKENIEDYLQIGELYIKLKEHRKAIPHLNSGLKVYSESTLVRSVALKIALEYNLGGCWEELGEEKKAIRRYQNAINEYEDSEIRDPHGKGVKEIAPTLYHKLGALQGKRGALKKAARNMHKAVAKHKKFISKPDSILLDIYHNLGFTYEQIGLDWKALIYYTEAITISYSLDRSERYYLSLMSTYAKRANLYNKLGQVVPAIKDYEKVLQAQPTDTMLYLEISELYGQQGEYDQAIFYAKEGITHSHDAMTFNLFYTSIALSYRGKEEFDQALFFHQKALSYEMDYSERMVDNLWEIAEIYEVIRQEEDALHWLARAKKVAINLWGEEELEVLEIDRKIEQLTRGIV